MQQPKTGRKFSVALNKYLDELGGSGGDTGPPGAGKDASAADTPPADGTGAGRGGSTRATADLPRRVLNTLVTEPSAPDAVDGDMVLAARRGVARKLQDATSTLASSSDIHDVQAVLALIEQCARTLSALNALSAPLGS